MEWNGLISVEALFNFCIYTALSSTCLLSLSSTCLLLACYLSACLLSACLLFVWLGCDIISTGFDLLLSGCHTLFGSCSRLLASGTLIKTYTHGNITLASLSALFSKHKHRERYRDGEPSPTSQRTQPSSSSSSLASSASAFVSFKSSPPLAPSSLSATKLEGLHPVLQIPPKRRKKKRGTSRELSSSYRYLHALASTFWNGPRRFGHYCALPPNLNHSFSIFFSASVFGFYFIF
ncbi:hypothetical protein V8C35DRAFT_166054 [Trichoderma chlorosporum]